MLIIKIPSLLKEIISLKAKTMDKNLNLIFKLNEENETVIDVFADGMRECGLLSEAAG